MKISSRIESYYASRMPIPNALEATMKDVSGSLIALAHVHVQRVPINGEWLDDESMSTIVGFRLLRPDACAGVNPNVYFHLGHQPNARVAIAAFNCEDEMAKAISVSNLRNIPLDHDDDVSIRLITRHMKYYGVQIPSTNRSIAWVL